MNLRSLVTAIAAVPVLEYLYHSIIVAIVHAHRPVIMKKGVIDESQITCHCHSSCSSTRVPVSFNYSGNCSCTQAGNNEKRGVVCT